MGDFLRTNASRLSLNFHLSRRCFHSVHSRFENLRADSCANSVQFGNRCRSLSRCLRNCSTRKNPQKRPRSVVFSLKFCLWTTIENSPKATLHAGSRNGDFLSEIALRSLHFRALSRCRPFRNYPVSNSCDNSCHWLLQKKRT